jgi:hypothetical protein
MRIKGAASWDLNEARLWILRPMEGLPDTGSNPAQMVTGSVVRTESSEKMVQNVCWE